MLLYKKSLLMTFGTTLVLQMLCIIIIWPSHAAHGFLNFVCYSTTPWVLQQQGVLCDYCLIILIIFTSYKYMVYSYNEKPSYSYKCSTRGFWKYYWFFYNSFSCTMNQQMHDWQFIILLLIILLLHVSTLLCNLQGARSQYLPSYVSRLIQSW